jgi:hypothetical protein
MAEPEEEAETHCEHPAPPLPDVQEELDADYALKLAEFWYSAYGKVLQWWSGGCGQSLQPVVVGRWADRRCGPANEGGLSG